MNGTSRHFQVPAVWHVFYPEQENNMYVLASGEVNMCVPTIVFGQLEDLDGEGGKKEAGPPSIHTPRDLLDSS